MRFQIEHRIGVQSPASAVWRHLGDFTAWPEWNPMYPKASGRLQIGAPLSLDEVVPGSRSEAITASVVDWVPEAQIVWTRKMWGGMVQRTRYFEIQALTEQGCVFSNGELFEGFAARFIPRRVRRALRNGFTGVGESLKARSEASSPEAAP